MEDGVSYRWGHSQHAEFADALGAEGIDLVVILVHKADVNPPP
jgi:hypothetical protein